MSNALFSSSGRLEAIKQEVKKLLEAGFIEEVQFPEWLETPVMVKTANGKLLPLQGIDALIDAITGHGMLSFMDGFSGYNQIKMHNDDTRKIMEVYVHNMLVNNLAKAGHINHLTKAFQVLTHHRMMLCAFGVGSGKFLGHMVSKRGIEVNVDKIKSILDMEPPHSIKDVQQLIGSIAAIGRLISKSGDNACLFSKP
ncbi:uncharacterized protein LOC141666156 [Apium graveolens]|uniref:uncharacterized protein LOC141666156 n=1 Tax=Apium graveolens TaxID=4045 RepID=UPI003D78E2C1